MLKRFQSMTIARRITILYGGVFSFAILMLSFVVFGNAAMFNQSIIKLELMRTVDNIRSCLENGETLTQDKLADLLDNKYVEVLVFKQGAGELIKSSVGTLPPFVHRAEPMENQEPQKNRIPEESSRLEKTGANKYAIQESRGQEFMTMEKVIAIGNDVYFIQTFKMLSSNLDYLKSFGFKLILMDAIGILLAFLIGKYISHLFLQPVITIRQTAERISIEDLGQRIPISGPDDEMKGLSLTFNSMIERLEESFKQRNQFISDASHELRTPISVIQGYANLVNRWGKSDPNVLQEAIDSIMAETEHMSTLIKKLLFLAKGDQNKNHIQKIELSLNETVEEIVKELNVLEIKRKIVFQQQDQVILYADSDLMKQLLWIFTENALKYTSEESGKIIFRVYSEGEYGCISVADNGAGMDKEDIPLIFDRFYRSDKSRNKEIPGTGLGLSIAKWIIEIHKGTVSVKSEKGKGSIFLCKFKKIVKEKDGK